MAAIQEYKCPCCGGAIAFDSRLKKMKCPYCDTEFEMDTLAGYDDELKNEQADDMSWDQAAGGEWQDDERSALRSYVCKSCGGEIACDENTAAAWKKHCEGKRLLPKVFTEQRHMNEIKGVYVPFWLFYADAKVNMRYKATKVRTWSDSNYYYTETKYYSVSRGGRMKFERIPVDGSEKMPDDLMESIEPFDFTKAVDFQTAYLAGYLADKYDADSEQGIARANERIKKSAEKAFDETVKGYATVKKEASGIKLKNSKVKYALFPVWILSTTWNGRQYLFAVNGQSGKMAGDLPLDQAAYKKWLFGLTGIIGAALYALSYFIWLM